MRQDQREETAPVECVQNGNVLVMIHIRMRLSLAKIARMLSFDGILLGSKVYRVAVTLCSRGRETSSVCLAQELVCFIDLRERRTLKLL